MKIIEKIIKNKYIPVLYLFLSICFYISAILHFANQNSGIGVVYLCLGSTFLCLRSVHLSTQKKDNNEKK